MEQKELNILLDKAARICIASHTGQTDKSGKAYFQHPMRVALSCKTDEERIVALLHDVIEDSDMTAEGLLAEGFPEEIVEAVLSVTKREGEDYESFVARAKNNKIGRAVKIKDLEDNLNALRLDGMTDDMGRRFDKYLKARRFLLEDDDINHSEATEKPRVQVTVAESYRQRRAEVMKRISRTRSNYMESKISVVMPNRSLVSDSTNRSTMIKVLKEIGFEKVAALNIMVDKRPIVTKEPQGNNYAKESFGWYVYDKWFTRKAVEVINKIADELNLNFIADMVPK